MYFRTLLILFLSFISLDCCLANSKDDELKKFERDAWNLRTDLVHNHTYELSNLKKADSLYNKSVEMNSILGKLYALQIRTYALVGNGKTEEFLKTVDEFAKLALDNKKYDEYFDASSAKTQYLMGINDYSKALFQAKDMVEVAEKVNSQNGIYESNLLLGQIYKYRGSWQISVKHLNKSLEAVKKMQEQDSIPYCLIYRELSECYSVGEKHDLAIEYAQKAKEWAPFDVYKYFSEWSYLAALYNSKDMKRFLKAYSKSPLNTPNLSDILPEEMGPSLLVMVHVARGEFDEALKLQAKDNGSDRYSAMAALYYHMGNYKKAYEYIVLQQTRNDSIETVMQQDDLSEMEARLGNAILQNETRMAKLKQRQILIISVVTLLIFVIFTMFYLLRRRSKHNAELSKINAAIERKNEELVRAQAITQEALLKAEQANDMRSRFIDNMMHEIRTPLNAISGFTQVLTDPDMPLDEETTLEMRNIIMNNTENLTTMLNQIIHLSSFDSESEKIKFEETMLSTIVSEVVSQCKNIQKGVELVVKTSESVILTDKNLLEEALLILLHNSAKFTSQGTITIEAVKHESEAIISVTDTGIGIESGKEEKIFERFFKIDEFVPGTGLGLSLCRSIITALGGKVFVDTTHQEAGSRFVIILPLT